MMVFGIGVFAFGEDFAAYKRELHTEFAARGKLCGRRSAFTLGGVTSPRMARYRLWRYAQSANFAVGKGRLFLAYFGVRIPQPKGKKNRPSYDGLFSFGRGIGIRTPKYRVRVCCVTVTPFPYSVFTKLVAFRAHIYSHNKMDLSSAFFDFFVFFLKKSEKKQ